MGTLVRGGFWHEPEHMQKKDTILEDTVPGAKGKDDFEKMLDLRF